MTPKNLRGMVGVEAKSRAYTWGRRTSWLMPSATEGFGAHRLYLPCRIAQLLLNRSIKARSFLRPPPLVGFWALHVQRQRGSRAALGSRRYPKASAGTGVPTLASYGRALLDRTVMRPAWAAAIYLGQTTGPRGRSVRGFSGKGESVLLWEGPLWLLCPKLMVLNVRKPSNGTGAVIGGHRAEESGMGRGGHGPQGLKATAPNQLH